MAYIALARKWRPNSFADLVGQEHVAQTLENAIEGSRLHHAFLFTGTRGVGKTTSARILAKTLNCSNRKGIHPCGVCPACVEITKGVSLDVVELDGASNNSVDDVRGLIEQVKYAPMHGQYKIFVVDEVHMLTKSAFNALLKTLEEPPAHVVFIFATTEVNKVPITILSRIQRFDFKRISAHNIALRLKFICEQESIAVSQDSLTVIAEKADGSMRDALTFLDQVFAFCGQTIDEGQVIKVLGIPGKDMFVRLFTASSQKKNEDVFAVVEEFLDTGIEISVFINELIRFCRDLIYAKTSKDPSTLDTTLKPILEYFNFGDLVRIGRILTTLSEKVRFSVHPRVYLELTLARISALDRTVDIAKLIENLPNEAEQKKNTH
jgi:DNA polymerase III subunit gamma/tau